MKYLTPLKLSIYRFVHTKSKFKFNCCSFSTQNNDKVSKIFEEILLLNMSEASLLVEKLSEKFKFSSSITNPVTTQVVTGNLSSNTNEQVKEQKAEYTVIMQKIDPNNKAKLIREIKAIIPSLNLIEAKNFVENVPKIVKEKVKQNEANSIKSTLEAIGAQITLE